MQILNNARLIRLVLGRHIPAQRLSIRVSQDVSKDLGFG